MTDHSSPSPALDYASPAPERYDWTQGHFLLPAFICGITPIATGTICLVGYAIFRHEAFAMGGFFTLFAGVFIFLIGVAILLWHAILSWQQRRRPIRRWLKPNLALAGLLLANFPVAALYVLIGDRLMHDPPTISVINRSPVRITSFVVTDPSGQSIDMGSVPAGSFAAMDIDLDGEGEVTFTATTVNGTVEGTLYGYISGPPRDGATVFFHEDGTHSVRLDSD